MADTAVALTAIVVSGVVGPGLAAWWTRERQKADFDQELRRELREVLDEAAHSLGSAKRAFERVWVLYNEHIPRQDDTAKQAFLDWRRELGGVRYCEDRIAIRLGEGHPVHEAYCACLKTLEDQRPLAWAYERESPGILRAAARQEEAHRAYKEARRAYVNAAVRLVGPIPSSQDRTKSN